MVPASLHFDQGGVSGLSTCLQGAVMPIFGDCESFPLSQAFRMQLSLRAEMSDEEDAEVEVLLTQMTDWDHVQVRKFRTKNAASGRGEGEAETVCSRNPWRRMVTQLPVSFRKTDEECDRDGETSWWRCRQRGAS